MDRTTCCDLFNQIQDRIDLLSDAMPNPSKERRHCDSARRDLIEAARWMGFDIITPEQYEARKKQKKPTLKVVK